MDIYNQYVNDYNHINEVIHKLDLLDYEIRSQEQVKQNRIRLISLQSQLYYSAYYPSKTLNEYKMRSLVINDEVNMISNNYFENPSPPPLPPKDPLVPVPQGDIEHSCWYITWTSWETPVPSYVSTINLFVGNLFPDLNIGGFGNVANVKKFAETMKDIKVKISLGGGGGSYDNLWTLIKSDNVQQIANNLIYFCHINNVVGVDFDIECFRSADDRPELQALCGTLIKLFKQGDPTLETSYCVNAGFPSPNFPWQGIAKNILNACEGCLDRLYIMSYYDPIENEKTWVSGWVKWLVEEYNFTPSRISVGLDDFDAHAYDIAEFSKWARLEGLSTAYWCFNPNNDRSSNQSLKTIYDAYND